MNWPDQGIPRDDKGAIYCSPLLEMLHEVCDFLASICASFAPAWTGRLELNASSVPFGPFFPFVQLLGLDVLGEPRKLRRVPASFGSPPYIELIEPETADSCAQNWTAGGRAPRCHPRASGDFPLQRRHRKDRVRDGNRHCTAAAQIGGEGRPQRGYRSDPAGDPTPVLGDWPPPLDRHC